MRRVVLLLVIACSGFAHSQVWEKRLAPGVLFREEVERDIPRIVRALRISYGASWLKLRCEMAGGKVLEDTPTLGRETVLGMVERSGAFAGLNADFFQVPYTGDMLGIMVVGGKLVSTPIFRRAALGWGSGGPQFASPEWKGSVTFGEQKHELDAINEDPAQNRLVFDSDAIGVASLRGEGTAVVVRMPSSLHPNDTVVAEVTEVSTNFGKRPVADGEGVLIATGSKASLVASLQVGQKRSEERRVGKECRSRWSPYH